MVSINCLLLIVNCFISHRKDRWFFFTLQVFSPFFCSDIATQVPNSDIHCEHSQNLSPSIVKNMQKHPVGRESASAVVARTLTAVRVLYPVASGILSAVRVFHDVVSSILTAVVVLLPVAANILSAVTMFAQTAEVLCRP